MTKLSPAQYHDLWPADRFVSLLRRAKQFCWQERRNSLKSGTTLEMNAFEEAFETLHRLQGWRWRDVVQQRYFDGRERMQGFVAGKRVVQRAFK